MSVSSKGEQPFLNRNLICTAIKFHQDFSNGSLVLVHKK